MSYQFGTNNRLTPSVRDEVGIYYLRYVNSVRVKLYSLPQRFTLCAAPTARDLE